MSMFWEEDAWEDAWVVPDDVVDLVFSISGRCLPVDHAYALSRAVSEVLPWFADQPDAGLHLIHGADSGNGWYRPEQAHELMFLSRRAKLTLRLAKEHVEDARGLSGKTLRVAGNALEVGAASIRPLSPMNTLYARYVATQADEAEEAFLGQVSQQLREMGVRFKKILAGRMHRMATEGGCLVTRSLMVADLSPEDSVRLQRVGLGPHRILGCGLFIPHKAVKNVYRD